MAGFVLIESTGRESGPGCARFLRDAAALARDGHPVRVMLVQEGVTAALPGALDELDQVVRAGAELWVDEFSVLQRGMREEDLVPTARMVGMAEVAGELLAADTKVVWH
ncbi:DsrE family protein [Streptomyces sp. NPDC054864]